MSTPPSSTVRIVYDGADITQYVLFNSARFECQTNAVPGSASFTVKDENRTLSFEVGKEIYLYVDDIKMYGGIVMRIGRQLALPVDNTSVINNVLTRQWTIEALDFNIWFDKRVIRYPTDYTAKDLGIDIGAHPHTFDGTFIRTMLSDYIDVPPGVNMTTYVEDITELQGVYGANLTESTTQGRWGIVQQGSKWRDEMDQLATYSAAIYNIDADKFLHFESLQSATMPWSFVDHAPNGITRVACREVSATQDGSMLVTDALVWGGLDVAGSIYFGRFQDANGLSTYGRWQLGEDHFNEGMTQTLVDQRAQAIIDGPPGTSGQVQTGFRFPLWRVKLTWFAHNVPRSGGVPNHIRPGNLVNIFLYVMGDDVAHPLPLFLPLLNMTVTFPQLAGDGNAWVRFDGEFGLSYSDSRFLWAYILKKQSQRTAAIIVGSASNTSSSTAFGSFGTFTPTTPPDGARTVFTFPFPMLAGTIQVYVNALLWRENIEYTVTDSKTITFFSPLAADDQMYVEARTGTG